MKGQSVTGSKAREVSEGFQMHGIRTQSQVTDHVPTITAVVDGNAATRSLLL